MGCALGRLYLSRRPCCASSAAHLHGLVRARVQSAERRGLATSVSAMSFIMRHGVHKVIKMMVMRRAQYPIVA